MPSITKLTPEQLALFVPTTKHKPNAGKRIALRDEYDSYIAAIVSDPTFALRLEDTDKPLNVRNNLIAAAKRAGHEIASTRFKNNILRVTLKTEQD